MKHVLITGGCGFTGTVLTNDLVDLGYKVTVVDTQWFGNYLIPKKNLNIIKLDIRNHDELPLKGIDTVVHLASIANDPGVELNTKLSWEVNVLATQKLIENSIKNHVKHFIFASSGSVYGIKKEDEVTEDLSLVPVSNYNKTKMISERVLKSYENDIIIHSIRPATVCGYSPRMRLDVSVNMFAFQALKFKSMSVFGGNQIRPNIHIQDLINIYKYFISNSNLPGGFYNAGFENLKIIEIAKKVAEIIPSEIVIKKENKDPRSYRQNSNKLLSTGFKKKHSVSEAIREIKEKYESKQIIESDKCYTVKWMKELNL
jgi:nucleoside-diphosphate-sugar epimerase